MLSDLLKLRIRKDMRHVGVALAGLGLTPNSLTVTGFLLNVVVAAVLAAGWYQIGGLILLPVAAFDMLDGAVARATDGGTNFGAFLDSTLDRYAEAVIFLGLLISYTARADALLNAAVVMALAGSLMVSYARARAEGLGLRCEVGLLPRPERIILLAAGLISGLAVPAIWLLVVLTNVTAAQRIWHVWHETHGA